MIMIRYGSTIQVRVMIMIRYGYDYDPLWFNYTGAGYDCDRGLRYGN